MFAVGIVVSAVQLSIDSQDGGEWFALVATSLGFLCSVAIAIGTRRFNSGNR